MANKRFSDEEMDFMMHNLAGNLQELFGDSASVHCVKSNKHDFLGKIMSTYMNYPILKLEMTREGCNIQSSMCSVEDIINNLPHAIGSLLALVPEDTRNDILSKAIQEDMTKDGGLLDSIKEEDEEEEEDDD